ncbi:MAG: FtsK/SpoIIIE domain-containing protein [Ruminococcus sp.]
MKKLFSKIKIIRLTTGLKNIRDKQEKAFIPLSFLFATFFLWLILKDKIINTFLLWGFSLVMIAIAIIGVLLIISFIGTPLSAKSVESCLESIGFYDKAGNTPLLLSKHIEGKAVVFEFHSPTMSINEYQKRLSNLETALNLHIVSCSLGCDFQHVKLKTVPMNNNFDKTLNWEDRLLSPDEFVIKIGESQLDVETIDLNVTPHILIGGSTGSGKTVLLKLILMQCVRKKADVYIADFKGGVDYSRQWNEYCRMQFTVEQFARTLTDILEVLEDRRRIFKDEDCSNIVKYNKHHSDNKMKRIIVVCDEVAEIFDKTGIDKEQKALIKQIESMLSTIARQGRAFGIHLILATQRPDSEVLKGQIKSNIDLRICGRADKVLSQIILNNTDGAEKIPKDKQGVFLTNTGVLFKAYYFDDDEW